MKPYVKPHLSPGEELLFASGIHWKNYIVPFVAGVVLMALLILKAFYATEPLTNDWIRAFGGTFVLGGAAGSAASAAEYLAISFLLAADIVGVMRRLCVGYFITGRRIILMSGWLNLHSTEIQLTRCKAVAVKENIYERIFGTGDVIVYTAETQVYFDDVPHVRAFATLIQDTVSEIQIEDKGGRL